MALPRIRAVHNGRKVWFLYHRNIAEGFVRLVLFRLRTFRYCAVLLFAVRPVPMFQQAYRVVLGGLHLFLRPYGVVPRSYSLKS